MKSQKKGIVYFFKHKGVNAIKIGYSSSEDLLHRFNTLKTYAPYGCVFLGYIKTNNPCKLENKLHKKYNPYRLNGEWFNIDYDTIEKEIGFMKGRPLIFVEKPVSKCSEKVNLFLHKKNITHLKINRTEIKNEFISLFPMDYISPQQFYSQVRLFCNENNIKCIERKVNGLAIFELIKI